MVKLVNRNQFPPGGFQYFQAETGFEAPRYRSFETVVAAVLKHRLGNPYVAKKHNLATDYETVAEEVDYVNALRMKANPAWHNFIVEDEGGSTLSAPFFKRPQGRLASAAAGAAKTVAGVGVLLKMFGSGGRPVAKEVAERRAAVCVTGGPGGGRCPMNKPGDLSNWLTEAASGEVFKMFGILNDMKISTSRDAELGVCSGCLCPLKGKVQASISHIASEMKPEWKNDLSQESPKCWILTELEGLSG